MKSSRFALGFLTDLDRLRLGPDQQWWEGTAIHAHPLWGPPTRPSERLGSVQTAGGQSSLSCAPPSPPAAAFSPWPPRPPPDF
jgi:hypothetical protein